jgi:DNA-binding transcriptional ArsR family regulator
MDKDVILKAMAHPVRRDMLSWLKEPEAHFGSQEHPLEMGVCAGQFARCGLSQSTISAHLAALSGADLVTARRVGQWVFYKRNEETIAAMRSFLNDL